MRVIIDLLHEVQGLLHITARKIVSYSSSSKTEQVIIKRVSYELLANEITKKIIEGGFIKLKHIVPDDTFEISAKLFILNEDELFALISRAFTKGQVESSPCLGSKLLSKEEMQKIAYREQDK